LFALPAVAADDVAALQAKAEKGDAEAQLALGNIYGIYFKTCDPAISATNNTNTRIVICSAYKDAKEAAKWYRKAAEQGNARAQFKLADLYYYGAGVKQDYSEAYFWVLLFQRYRNPRDLPMLVSLKPDQPEKHLTPDQKAAVEKRVQEWKPIPEPTAGMSTLRASLKKGSVDALEALQKMAGQGNIEARKELCYSLFPSKRQAVPPEEVATKWCRYLAERGFPEEQRLLGLAYSFGRGVKQDYAEAYFWLTLGIRSDDNAPRDAAERHLTPEQKAVVDKRVAAWKKGYPASEWAHPAPPVAEKK
jgi:TPR repeat protein